MTLEAKCYRAIAAAKDGLRGAFAFPVQSRRDVLAVMVFFSREVRPAESALNDIFTSIGGQIGVFMTRKRAEEALRESEERFRILADEAPVLIWMSGPDKLCDFFNQVWLEFTGRNLEQELGHGWTQGVHPDDLQRCWDTYSTAFDARRSFKMEYRLRRFDGEYRWVLNTGVPRCLANGAFVGYIGSAIDITERKRAEEALRELPKSILNAEEAERRRVARELHDSVNQLLASTRFRLQCLEEKLGGENDECRQDTAKAKQLLESALQEVRRISHNLRPSALDDLGLIPAIRGACEEFSERTGIRTELKQLRWPRLAPETELALYRILQEALSNVEKHANATVVRVQLKRKESSVELKISDDGRGLGASAGQGKPARQSGLGLLHMRERATFAGGILTVRSARRGGTEIIVQILLAPPTGVAEAL